VTILRRVLYLDALLSAFGGILLAVAPGFLMETLLGQPRGPDDEVLRLFGIALFTLALFMVLVGHRIENLWWWSWAFVVLKAGSALVALLNAALGVPSGAPRWPWWVLGVISLGFAAAYVWGLGRAGLERPPL
jgi:asparagine N-glycosylation enzyme membrane subunit Stt3